MSILIFEKGIKRSILLSHSLKIRAGIASSATVRRNIRFPVIDDTNNQNISSRKTSSEVY